MNQQKRSSENYKSRQSQLPVEDVFSVTPKAAKRSPTLKKKLSTDQNSEHNAM